MEDKFKHNLPKGMGKIEEKPALGHPGPKPGEWDHTQGPKPMNEPTKTPFVEAKPSPQQQPLNPVAHGQPAAFPGATPDKVEPKTGKAFTGFPAKEPVTVPPVDPMIEQARQTELRHPAPSSATPTPRDAESDRLEHLARQPQNPKFPGPAGVTWKEDDTEKPAKPAAALQKPAVPGMVPMRANAPQDWRVGTMPAPPDVSKLAIPEKPDPKPVPWPANVKKSEGITYIPKYKKFHAEFKSSGQIYNVGMFDTEAQAVEGIAKAKAHLNP